MTIAVEVLNQSQDRTVSVHAVKPGGHTLHREAILQPGEHRLFYVWDKKDLLITEREEE